MRQIEWRKVLLDVEIVRETPRAYLLEITGSPSGSDSFAQFLGGKMVWVPKSLLNSDDIPSLASWFNPFQKRSND